MTNTGTNAEQIEKFLTKKLEWVKAGKSKEISLTELLMKEIEVSVNAQEEAYVDALSARTADQKHEAIIEIIKHRQDHKEKQEKEDIEPRKKGYIEKTFDELSQRYMEDPDEFTREKILAFVALLEINRRVRFFYDLQKLRVATANRSEIYAREFGIKDIFIDHTAEQLERLERHNEKMIDRILKRSPNKKVYEYLTDNYLGVGVLMAGCIISEIGTPERFRSISALWTYCGLAVIGNDPETGRGGHSQRLTAGETANWNHFLKTKLLGVMSGCMVKAQTRYIGTPDEKVWAKNVKCLNDYKSRLNTINELIPESKRVYDKKGTEQTRWKASKKVEWYNKDGKLVGEITQDKIERRSKKHINIMAERYMVKMFLIDVLNKWREINGLEPFLTYDETKLRGGRPHGK